MAGGGIAGAYSKKVAFVYIFNLIVGVGALALPAAFNKAGMFLGMLFVAWCAALAYICLTFVIEAMGASNALLKLQREKASDAESANDYDNNNSNPSDAYVINSEQDEYSAKQPAEESAHLLQSAKSEEKKLQQAYSAEYTKLAEPLLLEEGPATAEAEKIFEIKERTELGAMSEMFLGKFGKIFFYIVLVIYLYGDLAIYCVAVPVSVVTVTGPFAHLSQMNSYRVCLAGFAAIVLPFCFMNFSKTKYLQICTLITRNIAFITMIVLGFVFIGQGKGARFVDVASFKHSFKFEGVPYLFGVVVYSFMCHHSLPSIVTPITNKRRLNFMFAADFVLIFVSYIMLSVTALFAFANSSINDVYTLNFNKNVPKVISYYLRLFPVFTITTNYPLISITLRNNLLTLFSSFKFGQVHAKKRWVPYLFAALASIPPMIIGIFTENVGILVSFTGSFAGLAIQYLIPSLLVFAARRRMGSIYKHNIHQSPFKHKAFVFFIWAWCVFALGMSIYNAIVKFFDDVLCSHFFGRLGDLNSKCPPPAPSN